MSVWPLSISLAATLEIDVSFSSYGYLDVSVPRVPLITLCIHVMIHTHYHMWVPPFGNLRVRICASNRSLSQLITSFVGSQCQGIHPMLFLTWPFKSSTLALKSFSSLLFFLSVNSGFSQQIDFEIVTLSLSPSWRQASSRFVVYLSSLGFYIFSYATLFSFQGTAASLDKKRGGE